MRFRYKGDEMCEWFGFQWIRGIEHDVTDDHAIGKLKNSVLFEAVDAKPAPSPAPSPARAKADK